MKPLAANVQNYVNQVQGKSLTSNAVSRRRLHTSWSRWHCRAHCSTPPWIPFGLIIFGIDCSYTIMVCPDFWAHYHILYRHPLLGADDVSGGSCGSSSVLFVMKVMVWDFVSNSHKVMIAPIVMLPPSNCWCVHFSAISIVLPVRTMSPLHWDCTRTCELCFQERIGSAALGFLEFGSLLKTSPMLHHTTWASCVAPSWDPDILSKCFVME
jgi:hypothetical protein